MNTETTTPTAQQIANVAGSYAIASLRFEQMKAEGRNPTTDSHMANMGSIVASSARQLRAWKIDPSGVF